MATQDIGPEQLRRLADELENFEEIAEQLRPSPGDIPELDGLEIDGLLMPLLGAIGGDHVVYVDFKKRYDLDALARRAAAAGRPEVARQLELNKRRAGILLADVAGHRITDALVAAMLHQAFLLGAYYELEDHGQITTRLIEHLKTRFFESTNIKKLVAMIYGELDDAGRFRFVSAGHVPPLVFSRKFDRLMPLDADRTVSETPLGLLPGESGAAPNAPRPLAPPAPEPAVVNEIQLLGEGDVLLLATDGLTDHAGGRYVAEELGPALARVKDLSAREICAFLRESILAYAPQEDDISFVVAKRLPASPVPR